MPKWPFQVRGGGQRGPFQFLQDSQDSAFDPASLFASGEQGALLIPGPATTFQISDGTTAAGNGDPVGYIADASGNGNHAVQSVGAARPTLRQSGALWYAETDGVDDWLSAGGLGFTIDDAWTSIWASSIGSNGKFYWSYILATAGAPRLIGDSADVGWYDGISYSSLVPASEGNHVFTLNATSGASANLTGRIDGVTESTITKRHPWPLPLARTARSKLVKIWISMAGCGSTAR
jgi:hypothetical protein